jgi:hypothetical protein
MLPPRRELSEEAKPMGKINWGRVFLGGLVAAMVIFAGQGLINGVVLKDEWMAAAESINRQEQMLNVSAMGYFVAMALLLGVALAWFYAAARPRFGPGPGTAVKVGLAVWLVAYFLPTLGWVPMDLFTTEMLGIIIVCGVVQMLVAALVAGALYKEAQG